MLACVRMCGRERSEIREYLCVCVRAIQKNKNQETNFNHVILLRVIMGSQNRLVMVSRTCMTKLGEFLGFFLFNMIYK